MYRRRGRRDPVGAEVRIPKLFVASTHVTHTGRDTNSEVEKLKRVFTSSLLPLQE